MIISRRNYENLVRENEELKRMNTLLRQYLHDTNGMNEQPADKELIENMHC